MPTVSLDPAPAAADPRCAQISVRLPDTLAGAQRRNTDAQATGAWGSPASVILHCGVRVPGPTTARCISIDGVDWVEDASRKPVYTYTSFGRDPATEVTIDSRLISASTVLTELTPAVGAVPSQRRCIGPGDVPPLTG